MRHLIVMGAAVLAAILVPIQPANAFFTLGSKIKVIHPDEYPGWVRYEYTGKPENFITNDLITSTTQRVIREVEGPKLALQAPMQEGILEPLQSGDAVLNGIDEASLDFVHMIGHPEVKDGGMRFRWVVTMNGSFENQTEPGQWDTITVQFVYVVSATHKMLNEHRAFVEIDVDQWKFYILEDGEGWFAQTLQNILQAYPG